ncbi:MAG: KamA family radical SAM protein [Planctomycetaceae bacterium]|nr:KamA family radical SAM protein [Planctomycetaceae bacterium]
MNDSTWQNDLRQSITDTAELCRLLDIPERIVQTDYPLLVPRPFADLMEHGNPDDPLLLQVLPCSDENQAVPGFSRDPLGEIANAKNSALSKYAGRTLLLASQACGIHCRFCFRRHHPNKKSPDVETLLAPIRQNTSTEEVILSGGDPLMLDDETLDELLQSILRIKHIRRLRIHTRLPVVLPSRLTPYLAEILTLPIPLYLVLHINHPHELSDAFLKRRELLTKPIVLAQSVLLRRVNDDAETLNRLFCRLIDARILPYYLHQLDRVAGSAHFEVAAQKGVQLLAELRNQLPGYGLPTYVREVAGNTCKEIIGHQPGG